MEVEGARAAAALGPGADRRQPRQPHGPGRDRRRRAQAPPDPRAREGDASGTSAACGADPQRHGPDPDRARQGRRGRARQGDRGAARRRLHRRLPRGHALARARAARPQRHRPPRRGGARDRIVSSPSPAPPTTRAFPKRPGSACASARPRRAATGWARTTASSPPGCWPRSAPASRDDLGAQAEGAGGDVGARAGRTRGVWGDARGSGWVGVEVCASRCVGAASVCPGRTVGGKQRPAPSPRPGRSRSQASATAASIGSASRTTAAATSMRRVRAERCPPTMRRA